MNKKEIEDVLKVNITTQEYDYLKVLNLHTGNIIHTYIALLKYREVVIYNFDVLITDTISGLEDKKAQLYNNI